MGSGKPFPTTETVFLFSISRIQDIGVSPLIPPKILKNRFHEEFCFGAVFFDPYSIR